ncbi:nicotinate-nucleotide--dimethylbenzimidazole phosphoribosyltransferase, partial [Undibacterium luofuense]|uniref:nicotinate-nucleotide--dimethylbenzimidazole phosphoribosyltransferase n=1 Tax=Undibacterium luofuense TaxID=2828733 RepID=UPI0030EDC2FA
MRHPQSPGSGKAVLLVFAGDHGLTAEGVSQYPSAVTVAMVMTYLAGRACANAFAAASDVTLRVIDAGVAAGLPEHPGLIDAKANWNWMYGEAFLHWGVTSAMVTGARNDQGIAERDAINHGIFPGPRLYQGVTNAKGGGARGQNKDRYVPGFGQRWIYNA